ncbi:phosphatidylserine decarboxylase [Candidatus Cytomitobacter primus]|uniref:Phosphatidylserine decarboxylase n=1 Tax=Candidatus Cytomitobacter primus TaxID=2066024 RepID=A0A5C0UFW4_9PROT|nr:phosphatidylserine decarboxylase [Candidatus Cytomitobacter primus]QEK38533.1 hypothetical protein FZC34_01250 [Candidatus Cytomitobacter primus]
MFKLSQDGTKIAKIIAIGLVLSFVLGSFIAFLAIGLLVLFRDENRVITNPSALLSPCDGIILSIDNDVDFTLSDQYQNIKWNKITILNGILDIHVSRMPIKGKIEDIIYSPGESRDKYIYKQNEKISWVIAGDIKCIISHSVDTVFHFVSCKVKRNDILNIGSTYANNVIGATVEVYVPQDLEICVSEGQKMIASETPLIKKLKKSIEENIEERKESKLI